MSSFIFIELDTRPPDIKIYSPSYTTSNVLNKVTVKSDENLSDFQDIFIRDSENNVFNYTFKKIDDKTLVGEFVLDKSHIGTAFINVMLEDEVGNKSKLVNKSIDIIDSENLVKINTSENSMRLNSIDSNQSIDNEEEYMFKTKDVNLVAKVDSDDKIMKTMLEE